MAKKKYVHAATLRRRVNNCLKDFPCEYTKEDVLSCIDRVPAADVEPVRHGKWIKTTEPDTRYTCSRCDNHYLCDFDLDLKYCPNCGTKMDLENEDK